MYITKFHVHLIWKCYRMYFKYKFTVVWQNNSCLVFCLNSLLLKVAYLCQSKSLAKEVIGPKDTVTFLSSLISPVTVGQMNHCLWHSQVRVLWVSFFVVISESSFKKLCIRVLVLCYPWLHLYRLFLAQGL